MSAQTRQPAIEQIENARGKNKPDRVVKLHRRQPEVCVLRAVVDAEHGRESAEEVARRHEIRQQIDLRVALAHLSGKSRDDTDAAGHPVAHFHQHHRIEGQVYFRSRAEANHPEVFALLEFVAHFRPADNSARDHPGELAHNKYSARVLKRPRHRPVLCGAIGVARVEAEARVRFSINDFAIDRRAIGVHVEHGEKYSHSFLARVENFGLFDFYDVRDGAVGGGEHRIRIIWRNARRIPEEPERVNGEQENRQQNPERNENACDSEKGEHEEDPARFVKSLESHKWPPFSRPSNRWSSASRTAAMTSPEGLAAASLGRAEARPSASTRYCACEPPAAPFVAENSLDKRQDISC